MVHHFSPTMGSESNVLTEKTTELRRPSLYKVLLLNDDYTPMDFVVMILEQIFCKIDRGRHANYAGCSPQRRGHLWSL